MIEYPKTNSRKKPALNAGERLELDFLRKEVPKLREQAYGQATTSPAQGSTASDINKSDSSSDSEPEDAIEDLPVKKVAAKTGPRMSVSAEVFGKFNKQEDYIPPVHKKSEDQIRAIKQKMENNFMFSTLNPIDKKKILDAVVPVTKQAGEVIIQEGDDGDNFYLVEECTLTCTKYINPSDKEETFLKEYVPGESFGELALLYNAPRAATITCKSATCELWSLDRNTFNHIIKTAVQKKREKYDDFLGKVEILKLMQKNERTKIADAFKEQWFEEGDYIIKQGDKDGSEFYMIIEGECHATKVLEPGKPPQVVKDYHPGDYFGERSLIRDQPRAANIVALTQVCVVSLDRQAFKRLMGPLEEILSRNEEEYKKFL